LVFTAPDELDGISLLRDFGMNTDHMHGHGASTSPGQRTISSGQLLARTRGVDDDKVEVDTNDLRDHI